MVQPLSDVGQEAWQCIAQWVWNIRLELGHQQEPTPLRLTSIAPALLQQNQQTATPPPLLPRDTVHLLPPPASESWAVHWSRFSSAARRNASLPSWQAASSPRTAQRTRWKSAGGLRCQPRELPSLCAARAVSVEQQRNPQTTPGEHGAPSAGGR